MQAKVDQSSPRPAPARRRVVSMRLIISVVTTSLIAVSVIGFGELAERNMRQTLSEEIEGRLILEARKLATLSVDALLTDYPELTLCPLVSDMQVGRRDLAFVAVLDHEKKIQGHIDLEVLGKTLPKVADMKYRETAHTLLDGEMVLSNAELIQVSVPARHANGRRVGTAIVGLSQSYLDEMVARPRRTFLMLTAGLLLISITVTLFIMSALLRPIASLRAGLERIGRGNLGSPIHLRDNTELGLLAETVNGMASQLVESQALMLEQERLGAEMSLAHQMQHALLPDGEVRSGDFVCKGTYRAAAEVGGDYYDIFDLDGGKLGLVIADVSGKGLAGCLVTSMLAVLIRSLRDQYTSPRELLINLEKGLLSSLAPGTFITIFYGILDPQTGRLVFSSAAHSPLAIYRAAKQDVEWVYTKGIPLGALRSGALAGTLEDREVALGPRDLALQFTDGLNEAWNPDLQEQYDFTRIAEHMIATAPRGGQAVQDELLPVIEAWSDPDPLGDDFTLLAIECTAPLVAVETAGAAHPAARIDTRAARDDLKEMMAGTLRLNLTSNMEELTQIRSWVEACLDGNGPLTSQQDLIENSLFEVCANIIEHGYGDEEGHDIDMWWVPLPGPGPRWDEITDILNEDSNLRNGVGYFVICDQGRAFDPNSWTPPDLHDPQVRRRGRGLGLQIVYASMKKVDYTPDTPAGNLTLLRFDPAKHHVK